MNEIIDTHTLAVFLCLAPTMAFFGGFVVGLTWRVLKASARDGTDRYYPRPGTQPTRPDGFKPFRKHPDMLIEDESKNP